MTWDSTVVSSGEKQKIAFKKVSDESSAKSATVGEKVRIGDELKR